MYKPLFRITSTFLNLMTEAAELRAWIGRSVVDVTWLPRLQRDTASRLAHSSTAIEGNPLTLPEVEALARGETGSPLTQPKREVLNYLAAMRWLWSQAPKTKVDEKNLLELHRVISSGLLEDTSIGRYKARPNRIVDHKGRTVYTPPAPEAAGPLTRELLAWIQSDEVAHLHPVLVSAIAHHRLVSIHPFSDGNGRTSRALAVWVLYTRGFDTHHLFALDEFFEADRQQYYLKIQQVRDLDDDLTYWLDYVGEGIVTTLRQTRNRIESLQVHGEAAKILLTPRQEDVLRYLRDRGHVRSSNLEKDFKLTRARIGQIIKPLVDAGIVLREGRTRGTTYRLAPSK
jgi:Fic family protein